MQPRSGRGSRTTSGWTRTRTELGAPRDAAGTLTASDPVWEDGLRGKRELVGALVVLAVAGCGGGNAHEVTLADVQPCLARLAATSPVHGGVAKGASEAVRLRMPSSAVTVLVASDADAASALATGYGVFRGARSEIGTVVLAWEAVPADRDESRVEKCIR